jgi:hypothetical protein
VGRDVAVDDAEPLPVPLQLVGVVEAAQHLRRDVERDRDREHPGVEELAQVDPADELHDEEVAALLVAVEVEHRGDVRVVQQRGHAGLVDEHLAERGVARQRRLDALDGDRPHEALGADQRGLEHLGHATAPDPSAQLVSRGGPFARHRAAV